MIKELRNSLPKRLFFCLCILFSFSTLKANIHAFVTNNVKDGMVSVFDADDSRNQNPLIHLGITKKIPVGAFPKYIESPASVYVYVVNQGDGASNGSVTIINGANLNIPPQNLDTGVYPNNIAFCKDLNVHSYAFIPNRGQNTVTVINTSSQTLEAPITVGNAPHFAAVNPSTGNIYVSNKDSGTVSIIDPATRQVIHTINISLPYISDSKPTYIAFSGTSSKEPGTAYIACEGRDFFNSYIYAIPQDPNDPGTAIPLLFFFGGMPVYISIITDTSDPSTTYDDDFIYVSCATRFRRVVLLRPKYPISTGPIYTTWIRSLRGPTHTAHNSGFAYMIFPEQNYLGKIPDTDTNGMTYQQVGNTPWTIGIPTLQFTSENLGHVPNQNSGDVSVINLDTFQVIDTIINVGDRPTDVAFANAHTSPPNVPVSSGGTEHTIFIAEEEFMNIVKWEPASPAMPSVVKYTVWRDSQYVGTVQKGDIQNGFYSINSHNCKYGREYTYSIVGEDENGVTITQGYQVIKTGE